MAPLRAALGVPSLMLAVWLTTGCGDSTGGRNAVSGTIKLKGQPLDQGMILFVPLAKDGKTQAGAVINQGTYEIPKPQGLLPGKYLVSITSPDGKTPDAGDAPPGPSGNFASKDRIPKEYNLDTKLQFEIKNGANKFDFDVP